MSLFLGINTGHDSGVSLISYDEVVVAENEERYSRVKNHVGFPFLSLKNALKQIDPSQIQLVGIEGKKILPFYKAEKFESAEGSLFERYLDESGLLKYFLGTKLGVSSIQHGFSIIQKERKNQIIQFLRNSDVNAPVEWFDHHHCHAASATLVQNRDGVILDGLSFSMDASGEGWCSKVYLLRKGQLIEQKEFRLPSYHSPANLYMHVTRFLGYRALRHEGKVTGLAAFGNHLKTASILSEGFRYDRREKCWVNKVGYRVTASKWLKKQLGDFSKEDIAAGVQHLVENSVLDYLEDRIIRNVDDKSFFLSGGLFANVRLNQIIAERDWCERLYVAPNMGDGGLNIGAAALARDLVSIDKKSFPISSPTMFLGHEITFEEALEAVVRANLKFELIENIPKEIANSLSEKKVIALACGRMEYGPRALCNRSILYHASDRTVNQWLNQQLKRTEFMPFAPVLKKESAEKVLKMKSGSNYRNMTITCEVKREFREIYPAIVHVDYTARPQVVEDKNSLIYRILSHYEEITGMEVLVNTSFNLHEEPIVRTAEEAIKSFLASKLDFLFMPNIKIWKEN